MSLTKFSRLTIPVLTILTVGALYSFTESAAGGTTPISVLSPGVAGHGSLRSTAPRADFSWSVTIDVTQPPELEPNHGPSVDTFANARTFNLECTFQLADNEGGYWNLAYTAAMLDPQGGVLTTQVNDLYKPSITGWMVANVPDPTSGEYRCVVDWYVEGNYLGTGSDTAQVTVQVPTSLNMYATGNLSGTPNGCSTPARYWVYRDYQVRDQQNPPQPIQKVMTMSETFTPSQNGCNATFIEGGGPTQSNGTFRDNLFLCGSVPACDGGGSCTTVRNQTWKADNHQVGQYTLTYTCSGVTVQ